MAVLPIQLELIKHILTLVPKPLKMLSLGYPDILASDKVLENMFGAEIVSQLRYRADSEGILAWHKMAGEMSQVVESDHFFKLIGIDFECIDIVASRQIERVVDLNFPVPQDLWGKYQIVMDPGTIEHCANIGQALMNLANMVAPGGFVVHTNPLAMFNHGFYNLNPTLYADFYEHNGFKVEFLSGLTGKGMMRQVFQVPVMGRFYKVPENASIIAVARRERVQPLGWPMQRKYRVNPDLKG